jgi:hypothetical protein
MQRAWCFVSFACGLKLIASVCLNSRGGPEQMREKRDWRKVSAALRGDFELTMPVYLKSQ